MDSHCVYQIATYVLVHGQIRLLSGDAFSLRALKYLQIAHPPQSERNLLLKGMGDDALVGLFYVTPPNKRPLLIKIIGTTRLDHTPGRTDRYPVVKLAKVDSDTPWVHLRRAL